MVLNQVIELPINNAYASPGRDFYLNGESVVVYHAPAAATDGDSIVHFRGSDVVAVGNLFNPDVYPVIDIANGAPTVQAGIATGASNLARGLRHLPNNIQGYRLFGEIGSSEWPIYLTDDQAQLPLRFQVGYLASISAMRPRADRRERSNSARRSWARA